MDDGSGDIYNKCFKLLQSENRKVRKQNLEKIQELVLADQINLQCPTFLTNVNVYINPCLNDDSETCRETAVQLMKNLVCNGCCIDISTIIHIIHKRMAGISVIENSEELKLLYVQLLRDIIKHNEVVMESYLDEVAGILKRGILDSCPSVKKESCLCSAEFAYTTKEKFHMVAETLIEPMIKATKYHQSTIRITAIESLNYIIMHSNGKQVPEVCNALSERLFDQNTTVRLTLCHVVSNWMLLLPDRYSYFPKLVPLILSAQVDDHKPNRDEAEKFWKEIGIQYLNENEEKLKEKIDFLPVIIDHYPPNVERPNLGCRILVAREVLKLLPVIIRELDDWKEDVCIKSGQLLCVVALNAEGSIIQHLNQLLTAMVKCCREVQHVASHHIRKAAEIISYFVSPDVFLKFLLPLMNDNSHTGHMIVLAGLIRHNLPEQLSKHVEPLVKFLVLPEICENHDPLFKKYLLQVIEYIINICNEECKKYAYELFKIYITTQASALDDFENHCIFKELVNFCSPKTKEQLFKSFGEKLLNELSNNCDEWTVHSSGRGVLDKIVTDAEYIIKSHYEIYRKILAVTLQNLEKDSQFIMKMIINISTCVDKNVFDNRQLWQILSGVIFPILTWRPGRCAETLRAAASLSAQKIVSKLTSFNDDIFKLSFPVFLALADDNHSKTRAYSLDSLHVLTIFAKEMNIMDADTINNITRVTLTRLNDNPGITRFKAISLLKAIYTNPLPPDYILHYGGHIEQLYKTMIIFLDDEDVQQSIFDALKDLSWMQPDVLLKQINVKVFSHKHYAKSLVDFLSDSICQISLSS
ncbi:dynein axonemal assembly factor 5 isoform X2 [Daktulosphaira vitifoliae]|uniref:dynein axonemal assembly factor 5 isoform X2 n=1 Tax=Daktulosphaira vitifoliae TaxID=58002 RepID=UPI0021AAFB94|nr:dynein axonemal assembly factor 5 isoform X2 [Daktulosphaira vitifoliae]